MRQFSILAFGGNEPSTVGSVNETLTFALKSLAQRGVIIHRESSRYVTPAFPAGSGPDFVNMVALTDSEFKPTELLEILHEVEQICGRQRLQRWGARTLDIDLIDCAGRVLPSEEIYLRWHRLPLEDQTKEAPAELILPHPRTQDRAFVLVPLCEIYPDWKHPVLGLTAAEMLSKLPESEKNQVLRVEEP